MYSANIPKKQNSFLKRLGTLGKKPVFRDLGRLPSDSLEKTMQGLLGNYLLRQMTPESVDIDLFQHMLKLRPNKNFELGLQRKDKNSLLNLNWRF